MLFIFIIIGMVLIFGFCCLFIKLIEIKKEEERMNKKSKNIIKHIVIATIGIILCVFGLIYSCKNANATVIKDEQSIAVVACLRSNGADIIKRLTVDVKFKWTWGLLYRTVTEIEYNWGSYKVPNELAKVKALCPKDTTAILYPTGFVLIFLPDWRCYPRGAKACQVGPM